MEGSWFSGSRSKTTSEAIQIGSLGIPMIFNNVLNNRSLEEAHATAQRSWTRAAGCAGWKDSLRSLRPILDKRDSWGAAPVFTDPTPRGITFEGFYEWMVSSQAYAENEWKDAKPWNSPTALSLAPSESRKYGVGERQDLGTLASDCHL
jgi:hypothetical protein